MIQFPGHRATFNLKQMCANSHIGWTGFFANRNKQ
jgi:hypothetical protein